MSEHAVPVLVVHVGPLRVRVDGPHALILARFGRHAAAGEVTHTLRIATGAPSGPDSPLFAASGATWRVSSRDVDGTIEATSATVVSRPTPAALASALRLAASVWLPRAGALLVHAASAARDGRAMLFAGRSGVGKSTLARRLTLAGGDNRPGDDRHATMSDPSGIEPTQWAGSVVGAGSLARPGWALYGEEIALVDSAGALHRHPFGGHHPERAEVPLSALCFLAQAPEHRAWPLSPPDACARILSCAMAHEPAVALHVAAALAARVPAFEAALAHRDTAPEFVGQILERAA